MPLSAQRVFKRRNKRTQTPHPLATTIAAQPTDLRTALQSSRARLPQCDVFAVRLGPSLLELGHFVPQCAFAAQLESAIKHPIARGVALSARRRLSRIYFLSSHRTVGCISNRRNGALHACQSQMSRCDSDGCCGHAPSSRGPGADPNAYSSGNMQWGRQK